MEEDILYFTIIIMIKVFASSPLLNIIFLYYILSSLSCHTKKTSLANSMDEFLLIIEINGIKLIEFNLSPLLKKDLFFY